MKKLLLIIVFIISFFGFSQTLDPSFDTDGILTNQFLNFSLNNYATAAAMQPDGKMIYVGGINFQKFTSTPFIARVNSNGTLDDTFNGQGFNIYDINQNSSGGVAFDNVIIQSDGKIVVLDSFHAYRFNIDGSLDNNFGVNGEVLLNIETNGVVIYSKSIALQSDGKIVIVGQYIDSNNNSFIVIRLNTDGSYDTSFNINGRFFEPFGTDNITAFVVAIQSDGSILVGGETVFSATNPNLDFAVIRITTNGNKDVSFGNVGKSIVSVTNGKDYGRALEIQPDGKILLAGSCDNMLGIIGLLSNGTLDTSFNNNGILLTTIPSSTTSNITNIQIDKQHIKVLNSGKILISGTSGSDFSLLQLNSNGSFDTTFGTNGLIIHDVGDIEYSGILIVKPDGKIITGGHTFHYDGPSSNNNTSKIQELQFSETGILESSYQLNLINGTEKIISVLEQSDNKTIALTSTNISPGKEKINLIRYHVNGTIDTNFGVNGIVIISNNISTQISKDFKIKKQTDEKFLVVGGNSRLIYRFNADGSFDNNFGTNGLVDLTNNSNYTIFYIDNVYPQSNGEIFVLVDLDFNMDGFSRFGLLKLNSMGNIDTSFGSNGVAETRFDYFGIEGLEFPRNIFVQSDGKIVVSGIVHTAYGINPIDNKIGIARFNPTGFLDTTFGTNGRIIITETNSIATELLGYSDDKFIINYKSNNTVGATAKYNASGGNDNTFGSNGKVTDTVFYNDMILQSDGKILKAGSSNNQFYITRFNIDGSLDTNFGTIGSLQTPINSFSSINKILMLQNNKLLACGYSFNGTNYVFAQAKYTFDNLGIENNNYSKFIQIYPNPANNEFTIDFGNEFKFIDFQIKITNLLGQEISNSFTKTNITKIPITWTGKGLYFVNIYDNLIGLIKTQKIIIN